VLVARAIAQRASHLLLDEPTNHLDLHHQFSLLGLVTKLGCAVVMVLHDLNLAARFCTQLLVINNGEVVASGTPDEVLTPEILEPIYHLRVHRIAHENLTHLIFSPETESKENE
jgi:ABC superfamily ATP binding cassette transporter, ABC protein